MAEYTYPPFVHNLDTDDAEAVGVKQFADFLEEHGAEFDANSAETFVHGRQGFTNSIWRYRTNPGELYKYTDIRQALVPEYGINMRRRLLVEDPSDNYRLGISGLNAHTLYVVNDVIVPMMTPSKPGDKSQFYVGTIADMCESLRKGDSYLQLTMEKYLFRSGAFSNNDPISWLNSMLGQDGIFIYIPDNGKFPLPIQIINVSDSQTPMMSNRRIIVLLGHHAEADIVILDHSMGDTKYLTTQQVNVFQCYGSRLGLYSIENTTPQTTRFSNFTVHQEEDSRLQSSLITLRCGLSRNTMCVRQQGDHVETNISGTFIADAEEHADNYVRIEHGRKECTSDMLFKYVVGGRSKGIFTGISYVERGSAKIESQQQHQSIVLSADARVHSQPVLEIYADDVKCGHGSTVGKLDEAALFYMRQRGIPEAEARGLLQHAFVNDVLQRIPLQNLRERLSSLVEKRLRAGSEHCHDCLIKELCK
ncbi:MAG: Fe-S cluster assembly protein SufD [Alloprevotella sp.]|nr:Fe-S cluster assembly protein SufD [Alloprevotella sp.]